MSKLFARGHAEADIQEAIIKFLIMRDWQIKPTQGTIYSFGWPDLYAAHQKYGQRWVEVKTPWGTLRQTQIDFITQFKLVGVGVWVLNGATPLEYKKLFSEPNWVDYLPN